jgi:hypothetical protein
LQDYELRGFEGTLSILVPEFSKGLEMTVSYDDQLCNLPVKILWSFNNTVAIDNTVFILTEAKIVETQVLHMLDSRVKETIRMFLDQTRQWKYFHCVSPLGGVPSFPDS